MDKTRNSIVQLAFALPSLRKGLIMAEKSRSVIMGADTHKQFHTVAVITHAGERLAAKSFDANAKGYRQALAWVQVHGEVMRAGVESCGTYGAGLCAHLKKQDVKVYDVYSPDKQKRRRKGKDDTEDAFQAAEAALSLERCAVAKDIDGIFKSLTDLKAAYEQAVKHRTATVNAIKATVVKLPDAFRTRLRGMDTSELIDTCAAFRVSADGDRKDDTKLALRTSAKRVRYLDEDRDLLDKRIKSYAADFLPNTMSLLGIAHHGATTLLCAVGTNIERMKSECSFSMLCGTSPLPVSTANSHHHRLNRGGNRKANSVIHTMAISRLKHCEKTQDFMERKVAEGKSKKDVIRILKRYIAREVYNALKADLSSLGLAV